MFLIEGGIGKAMAGSTDWQIQRKTTPTTKGVIEW